MPWLPSLLAELPAISETDQPVDATEFVQTTESYSATCSRALGQDAWKLRIDLQDETIEVDYDGKTRPNPGSVRGSIRRSPKG